MDTKESKSNPLNGNYRVNGANLGESWLQKSFCHKVLGFYLIKMSRVIIKKMLQSDHIKESP